MTTAIRFLGCATYEITAPGGLKILLDPWLDGNPASSVKVADLTQADLLLITHGAEDHMGEAGAIAKKFGSRVVCGGDVRRRLLAEGVPPDRIIAVAWGMAVDALGIHVRPVESHHWSSVTMPNGEMVMGTPLGMIITTEPGVRIYDGGDTSLFSDLKLIGELYRPNIGLMHVALPRPKRLDGLRSLTGELTPFEAVLATQWLGLEYVLPMHYLDPECEDVRDFCSLMETTSGKSPAARTVVLKPGEAFSYTPQDQVA